MTHPIRAVRLKATPISLNFMSFPVYCVWPSRFVTDAEMEASQCRNLGENESEECKGK